MPPLGWAGWLASVAAPPATAHPPTRRCPAPWPTSALAQPQGAGAGRRGGRGGGGRRGAGWAARQGVLRCAVPLLCPRCAVLRHVLCCLAPCQRSWEESTLDISSQAASRAAVGPPQRPPLSPFLPCHEVFGLMLPAVSVGSEMHGASAGQPVDAGAVQASLQRSFKDRLPDAQVCATRPLQLPAWPCCCASCGRPSTHSKTRSACPPRNCCRLAGGHGGAGCGCACG